MAFNQQEWLTRIEYQGEGKPTLDVLRQLHLCQPSAIAFENLDVILKRTIDVSDSGVFEKLVTAGRGGYCYEHNALFACGLRSLGYDVQDIAARVVIEQPDAMPPRTHRAMVVTLEGERWLADVGFGSQTLTAPLQLDNQAPQRTPHGTYRIVPTDSDYLLQKDYLGQWASLYRFDLVDQYPSDFLMANHFVATWPESHFLNRLIASRQMTKGGNLTLNNRHFSRREQGEKSEIEITRDSELYQTLQQGFNIRLDHPTYGITQGQLTDAIAGFMNVTHND